MKYTLVIALSAFVIGCGPAQNKKDKANGKSNVDYAETITVDELKSHLYKFASDDMQGRMTGTEGQKKAAQYLVDFYKSEGIGGPIASDDYYQPIHASFIT